ncbi:hypothetical protein FRC12_023479 [Ceratobasidium sp. 428]|nr:hypothetical protein FRC12_023479 [Ceratobasidium sp. 428]
MTTRKSSPLISDSTSEPQSPHPVTRPLFNPTSSSPVPSRAPTPVLKPPVVQQRLYFDGVELPRADPPIVPDVVRQYWKFWRVAHRKLQYEISKVDAVAEEKRALRPKALGKQEQRARDEHTARVQEEGRREARQKIDRMLADEKQKALEKLKNKMDSKQ